MLVEGGWSREKKSRKLRTLNAEHPTWKMKDFAGEIWRSTSGVGVGRWLLCAVLFCAPIKGGQGARRDVSKVITILCLGDSLTAGFGLTREHAFPALLTEKMRAQNYSGEVINAGSSGDTTAGGLRRLPIYLPRKIDVLVLELGINDAFRGVPVEQMRTNLQTIIDTTRARWPSVEIVIAGMQLPIYANDPYLLAFGTMYSELAEKNGAALIPFLLQGVGGDPTLNQADRVHPNAAGQRVLAENVWRVLEPVIRKATGGSTAHVN